MKKFIKRSILPTRNLETQAGLLIEKKAKTSKRSRP
jgi:hypothetical protein